jgi:hypothetical protein
MLALIRPDSWNFPLFLHVLGAMTLVGALVTAACALVLGWRRDTATLTRVAFRTLLLAGLPAYILMRAAAEWIRSKENYGGDDDPAWIGIGYITSDLGGLLLLISIVVTGLAARRLKRTASDRSTLGRVGGAITLILVVAYVIAIWAMTTKPA